MCSNSRWIYNPHTRRSVYVPCRHCEECLQASANRMTRRINFHSAEVSRYNQVALMVTLTYKPQTLPYVKPSDIKKLYNAFSLTPENLDGLGTLMSRTFPLYRNGEIVDRIPLNSMTGFSRIFNKNASLSFAKVSDALFSGFSNTPHTRGVSDSIGVIYYKDVQDFIDRFTKRLIRKHGFTSKVHYFICSEYGETYYRPHFHLLIFVPSDSVELFTSCIYESWTYASEYVMRKGVEIARNAAHYVSSYVCGNASLSNFLTGFFPPKRSFSQGFGCFTSVIDYDYLIRCADTRDFSFNLPPSQSFVNGYIGSIPSYIVNRLFPLIPSYFRIDDNTLRDALSSNQAIYSLLSSLGIDTDMIHIFITNFSNKCSDYISIHECNRVDYVLSYLAVWRSFKSYLYKMNLIDVSVDKVAYCYDNIYDYITKGERLTSSSVPLSETFLSDLGKGLEYSLPCNFPDALKKSKYLTELYYKKVKQRKVNAEIYSY